MLINGLDTFCNGGNGDYDEYKEAHFSRKHTSKSTLQCNYKVFYFFFILMDFFIKQGVSQYPNIHDTCIHFFLLSDSFSLYLLHLELM